MLHIDDLVVRYGSAVALDGASLEVGAGEMVALVGPNGAGKSTLINTVSGLLEPSSGTVRCEGRVAQVPEGRQMFPDMSVEDNLRPGRLVHPQPGPRRGLRPAARPGPDCGRRKAGRLSGGQQQMVAVGRALMAQPDLLAIDELSLGLAPLVVAELADHLRRSTASAAPPSCSSSRRSTLAFDVCPRACVLEAGRVIASGPSAELAQSEEVRRAYFGDLAVAATMTESMTEVAP